ncbi:hypothetical protein PR048_033008 [Dryococelus australis]|uniref:Uncharacterized protein n=1 Tax=Dryococelus australis TaxID=614101 RepID=A0ABQ9G3U7_9NEOP|nr:hypothetical protein PR048_033008 [Dryococelus australis]
MCAGREDPLGVGGSGSDHIQVKVGPHVRFYHTDHIRRSQLGSLETSSGKVGHTGRGEARKPTTGARQQKGAQRRKPPAPTTMRQEADQSHQQNQGQGVRTGW